MSKPAAFILATNDSVADEMITRKNQLNTQLRKIISRNEGLYMEGVRSGIIKKNTDYDFRPSLTDINSTHILYVRSVYKPNVSVAFEYIKSNTVGGLSMKASTTAKFDLSNSPGDFIHDQVLHIKFKSVGTPDPVNLTDGSYNASATRYRYCNFPGIKLLKKTSLKYNEEVIDYYTNRELLFHDKLRIPAEIRLSWNTLVGQQNPKVGTYYHTDQRITQNLSFSNGAQNPAPYQEELDLWIPLIFWYNLQIEASIMATSIVSINQCIEFEFEALNKIFQALNPAGEVIPFTGNLAVEKMELYTKNIFLDPEISDLFKNRASTSLIRVHKRGVEELHQSRHSFAINKDFKFPLEYMYLGVQPVGNTDNFDTWNLFYNRIPVEVPIPATIINPTTWPILELVSRTATFYNKQYGLSNLELTADTIPIYKDIQIGMYNRYQPYLLDGVYLSEADVYILPFSLFTTKFHPTGYLQLSKVKELFLNYESDVISSNNRWRLYIAGMALNFLIIDNKGNTNLKFAT